MSLDQPNGIHPKKNVHVISHSHWDRAWYLPFQTYRFRLVEMIDALLEKLIHDPSFKTFVLDGQTVLLEDYLEIRPEKKEILSQLIAKGRLSVGPWYVLPDLFLISGESVIRNFQLSRTIASEFGGSSEAGYIPDPFGHFAQLPQILQKLSIRSFAFMRGMPLDESDRLKLYFTWQAPDGSQIPALYLKEGYFNGSALGYPYEIGRFDYLEWDKSKAYERVKNTIDKLEQTQDLPSYILMNGMDHMPAQMEIPEVIAYLNESFEDYHFLHSSVDDALSELNSDPKAKHPIFEGDLLGNAHHPILSGVWSTRIYLKQRNHRCQSLLERVAEPALVWQSLLLNRPYDNAFVTYGWKELLKNHPHDDICGCSLDEVHRENETRFDHVEQIAHSLIERSTEHAITKGFKPLPLPEVDFEEHLWVWNGQLRETTQTVETVVFFKNKEGEFGDSPPENTLLLFDFNGNELPVTIIETKKKKLRSRYIDNQWGREYRIRFTAQVPPLGFGLFTARLGDTPHQITTHKPVNCSKGTVSIRMQKDTFYFANGTYSLPMTDLFDFEYQNDVGDTYSFSEIKDQTPTVSSLVSIEIVDEESLLFKHKLDVPKKAYDAVSTEIIIATMVRIEDNHLTFSIEYHNHACDGRLRLRLRTGCVSDRVQSDGHFRLASREIPKSQHPENFVERYNAYPGELTYPTLHQNDGTLIPWKKGWCWISSRGNHEFELKKEEDHLSYYLTLHRSVGYLSVGNGRIRRVQAGPHVATPEAQCLRTITAKVALGFTEGQLHHGLEELRAYSHPLYVHQLSHFDGSPKEGELPRNHSLISLSNPAIQLSSFRMIDDKHIVFRCANFSEKSAKSTLQLGFDAQSWCKSTLWDTWEETQAKPLNDNRLMMTFQPHEIVTLMFKV